MTYKVYQYWSGLNHPTIKWIAAEHQFIADKAASERGWCNGMGEVLSGQEHTTIDELRKAGVDLIVTFEVFEVKNPNYDLSEE
jgi:hypothetical protein